MKGTLDTKADIETKVESSIGPVTRGDESVSAKIRHYYTKTYKALDQFDQLWYECCYDKRDHHWETRYTWALILNCVINGRSAYCEAHGSKEPLKDFIHSLISEINAYIFEGL